MKPSVKLENAACRANVPLTLMVELTRACNLACRHCYVPPSDRKQKGLSEGEIGGVLRAAARAGSMHAVFTGGEPLLRKDIYGIIRRARGLAFSARILTNGTLISRAAARRLAESGVSSADVSVYGDAATHDFVTRRRGSFARTMAGVDALLENGLRVTIKTPLMSANYGCVDYIERLAASRGIKVKFDPTISPSDDGCKDNLFLRLDARRLARVYRRFGDGVPPERLKSESASASARRGRERLAECSAGRTLAAVSSTGELYPCPQLRVSAGNLRRDGFGDLWRGTVFNRLRRLRLSGDSQCASCPHLSYCQRCPGLALVEEGSLFRPPSEACRLSAIRLRSARRKVMISGQ